MRTVNLRFPILLILLLTPLPAAAQSVWELTPYRVQALVAAAPDPELTPAVEAELCAAVAERAGAVVGAPWELDVAAASRPLRSAMLCELDSIAAGAVPKGLLQGDKLLLVTVSPEGGAYQVAARELDVRTQIWGLTARRRAGQLAKLRDVVLDAMIEAFVPIASIQGADKQQAQLRLKASGLRARDPKVLRVHPGDVFRPVVRQLTRDGKLRRATPVAWTFCVVEKLASQVLQCRVWSGLQNPLAPQRRGRSDQVALRVTPPGKPSTLVLRSRTDPQRPLAGYEVFALAPNAKTPPDLKSAVRLGRTDSRGRLIVPPANPPLRMLLVKNGGELLGRLPIVPGLEPQVVAPLADDDQRLAAEAFITGMQEDLVDTIARREILLTRFRTSIVARQIDKAATLLDDVRKLPGSSRFARLMEDAKKKLASDDPIVQRKIDAMLADTQKLIQEHLSDAAIEAAAEEFRKARSAAPAVRQEPEKDVAAKQ